MNAKCALLTVSKHVRKYVEETVFQILSATAIECDFPDVIINSDNLFHSIMHLKRSYYVVMHCHVSVHTCYSMDILQILTICAFS